MVIYTVLTNFVVVALFIGMWSFAHFYLLVVPMNSITAQMRIFLTHKPKDLLID